MRHASHLVERAELKNLSEPRVTIAVDTKAKASLFSLTLNLNQPAVMSAFLKGVDYFN